MARRRRSALWLVGAALLLLAAAWLFGGGPSPSPVESARRVSFPRHLDAPAQERVVRRRSLTMAVPPSADAGTVGRPIDPVLAAMPPRGTSKIAVVVEANALVNSPIGQAFLDCLDPQQHAALAEAKALTGVDLLQDLDRLATSDGLTIASGHFAALDPSGAPGIGTGVRRGAHATVWTPTAELQGGPHIARWKDEMVLLATDGAALESALLRLERAEAGLLEGEPAIGEQESYGEVYGAIAPEMFGEILPPELASRLQEVAERVELHVGAEEDVGLVVEIDGNDGERVEEFARALGGALALGRVKATADGEAELAELLDLARVSRDSGRLSVELALPRAWLEERVLGPCRERARGDAGVPAEPPPPPPPSPSPSPSPSP